MVEMNEKPNTSVLWYSPTQAHIRALAGRLPTVPGKLADGTITEYTEIIRDGSSSLFNDAVRLGEGEYAGE
jgi:hypothetical protein